MHSYKKNNSRSQNGCQKRGLGRLTLTVVVELLNAARAASTVRVILPPVLFPRVIFIPIISLYIYHFFLKLLSFFSVHIRRVVYLYFGGNKG